MKNILDINISDYVNYFLTEELDPFEIESFTSVGYQKIQEEKYDLIQTPAGILIGYKTTFDGWQNHSYQTNSGRKYIQLLSYQSLKNILNKDKVGNFDFYLFSDSVYIPSTLPYSTEGEQLKDKHGNIFNRCDVDKFGGRVYYPVTSNYNIVNITAVLDIAGIAHVTYINTTNEKNLNPYSQTKNTTSRTLSGIIKCILEWAEVAESPFNNTELPAQKAKSLIEELNIPQDVIDWVKENQIDMGVSRYLKGNTDIAGLYPENEEIPECLSKFLKQNCYYTTVISLKKNHPRGHLIPDSILEKEENFLDSEIYLLYTLDLIDSTDNIDVKKYILSLPSNIDGTTRLQMLFEDYKEVI